MSHAGRVPRIRRRIRRWWWWWRWWKTQFLVTHSPKDVISVVCWYSARVASFRMRMMSHSVLFLLLLLLFCRNRLRSFFFGLGLNRSPCLFDCSLFGFCVVTAQLILASSVSSLNTYIEHQLAAISLDDNVKRQDRLDTRFYCDNVTAIQRLIVRGRRNWSVCYEKLREFRGQIDWR